MQLLPDQNFLLESFCFTEYLQFPQENVINCFIWFGTYSKFQIHRLVGVWRNLWRSPGPTPVPTQAHLQQDAQAHVWVGLCPEGDSTASLSSCSSAQSPSRYRSFSSCSHGTPCVSVCACCPSFCPTGEGLAPSSGRPPVRYLHVLMSSLFSCLLSRPNSPSSLSHSSQERSSSPFMVFAGSLGCREGQIPVPVQQCLAPIRFRETHSWRRTFRVVLSAAGVKITIRFKSAESIILLEEHPNESVCHFRTRINVEFPSHTHKKKSESYFYSRFKWRERLKYQHFSWDRSAVLAILCKQFWIGHCFSGDHILKCMIYRLMRVLSIKLSVCKDLFLTWRVHDFNIN